MMTAYRRPVPNDPPPAERVPPESTCQARPRKEWWRSKPMIFSPSPKSTIPNEVREEKVLAFLQSQAKPQTVGAIAGKTHQGDRVVLNALVRLQKAGKVEYLPNEKWKLKGK